MKLIDDRRRRLVPRWRPFRVAADLGLIQSERSVHTHQIGPAAEELEELRRDWDRHRTPIHAADLVDAAFVAGQSDLATDAAEFLVANDSSAATREIALAILESAAESSDPKEAGQPILTRVERRRKVAEVRRSLRRVPRNPIGWVELARWYSSLGQLEPAAQALRTAALLAPDNRFVLRAASRFYVHARDPARARDLLRRCPRTAYDPWLLAAEIVASQVAGGTSRWLKRGQRMIGSSSFDPIHISELAGAIGTLEYEHGNRKQVRRYFGQALISPTENAVAQAGWVARHMTGFELPVGATHVPRAFEATAWSCAQVGDFRTALTEARAWLQDEPFSTRPALLGSWAAVTGLGDYAAGAAIVEDALLANPSDPRLMAEVAFCYAAQDQLQEAERWLHRLEDALEAQPSLRDRYHWEVYLEADRGLIAYRRGRPNIGERHYVRAIELARERGSPEEAAIALLYFVGEASRFQPGMGRYLSEVAEVIRGFPESIRPAYDRLLQRTVAKAKENAATARLKFRWNPESREATE